MKHKISRNRQFRPTAKVEALARYVAEKLNDPGTLPFYVMCCNRYPESCIRKALAKTIEKQLKRVKTRRGEFLKQLIYEYAKETYNHSRNKSRRQILGPRRLSRSRTPGLENQGDERKVVGFEIPEDNGNPV